MIDNNFPGNIWSYGLSGATMTTFFGALIGLIVGLISGAVVMLISGFALVPALLFLTPLVAPIVALLVFSFLVNFIIWLLVNFVVVWILYVIANNSLTFPPTANTPVRVGDTFLEDLIMGVIIGMSSGINLAFWSMLPVPGAALIAPFSFVGFLASIPPLAATRMFQPFVGWFGLLMPVSWITTILGLIYFVVLAPIALVQFGPAALRIDFTTGAIETSVNLFGVTAAFTLGNFVFLTPGPARQTPFLAPGVSAHEAGHTLTNGALGGFFACADSIDENVIPRRGQNSWGELCAESNRPRAGRRFITLWT